MPLKQDFDELHQTLEGGFTPELYGPSEWDAVLETLYTVGAQSALFRTIADHYKVDEKTLRDMLIARQLLFVHAMTNYAKPASPVDLHNLLAKQQGSIRELVERATLNVSRLDQLIQEMEYLRSEATRVLAMYKTKYMKDWAPGNPK
jgi:hypothetical protein